MQKADLLYLLKKLGFTPEIIKAFDKIERRDFVTQEYQSLAYENSALPIGYGQTISQPQTIAFMLELLELENGQKVLEVGSGSGYVLALINQIIRNCQIFGAEIVKQLVERSRKTIGKNRNIRIFYTPHELGLPQFQPFDRILCSASAKNIPESLVEQLAENAILVCPVKDQIIKIIKRNGQIFCRQKFYGYTFVPLIENE